MALRLSILLQFLAAQVISLPCRACPLCLYAGPDEAATCCAVMAQAAAKLSCCGNTQDECCCEDDEPDEPQFIVGRGLHEDDRTCKCFPARAPYERSVMASVDRWVETRLPTAILFVSPLDQIPLLTVLPHSREGEARAGPHHKCSLQSLHCSWLN